jgi:ubiquitin-like 1-activating enzyme E1 B
VKRSAPDDANASAITSPSKKRRLEEDGLIMMESKDDQLRDDVIEID